MCNECHPEKIKLNIAQLELPGTEIFVTVDENFTTVFGAQAIPGHGPFAFAGTSKRNPKDKQNTVTGINLAYARALKNLANTIEYYENEIVAGNVEHILPEVDYDEGD